MVLAFTNKYGASLVDLEKEHESVKAKWEAPLRSLQDKLNESKYCVHEFEHNQDTIQ